MRFRYVFTVLASCCIAVGQPSECTAEDNGYYYDLTPLQSKTDYEFKSENGSPIKLNVCTPVVSEAWHFDGDPTYVAGFYRGPHGDVSMGSVNTTLRIVDTHPLLTLTGGSTCGDGTSVHAATAIRFICDNNVFGAGQPRLLEQLPRDVDPPCAYVIEWRTHVACPTAKPGGAGGIIAILAAVALAIFISYIVAGVLYRRFALGYRGFDQFPRISIIPLSSLPRSFPDFLDWLRDIRDHLRGGSRDLWPRSNTSRPRHSGWERRTGGFEPLAREEEQAMFRDGPDGPDARFSLEDETDREGARELSDATPTPTPPVPAKDSGPVQL